MGKRKRSNSDFHAGQEYSNTSDKSMRNSVRVEKKGRKQASSAAGQAVENRAGLSSLSGDKRPFLWNSVQLVALLQELSKQTKLNSDKPLDNSNINFAELTAAVRENVNHSFTRTQIYEKVRRLKEKYMKMQVLASLKIPNDFKSKDEEKIFQLSQKLWGAHGATGLQSTNEDGDMSSSDLRHRCKEGNQGQSQMSSAATTKFQNLQEEPPLAEINLNKPGQQLQLCNTTQYTLNADNHPTEQINPELNAGSRLDKHKLEGNIKSIIEVFHAKQKALLQNLENSCMAVLEHMETRFLNILQNMNNTPRRNRGPWMGTGMNLSSSDLVLLDSARDDMTDVHNQPSVPESLAQKWQQQYLQELKVTSLKLQLRLDECRRGEEQLE